MAAQNEDPTRVLEAPDVLGRTQVAQQADTNATQMGATVICAVCGTRNAGLETYCGECGFLLSSQPGVDATVETGSDCRFALVEERTGRRLPLRDGGNLIGREGAEVLLMDPTVSRRHAVLTVSGMTATLTDLASTNGTQVDGARIQPNTETGIAAGAVVQIGHVSLRLEVVGSASDGGSEATIEIASDDTAGAAAPIGVPAATPVARAEVARLRAQADDVSDIPVFEGATTLGRRSGNDWVIAGDPFVSGRHARLDAAGLSVTITDLGSTNGTTVNGERLPPDVPLPLESGDEVALGKGRYVLEHAAPADEEPAGYDDTPVDDDLDGDAVLSETDGEAA